MEELDKKLINMIQNGLPITKRPFLDLGEQLEISEEEVICRIESLKNQGYIRRFGGIFNSKKLGYCSTLCAISVPEDKIDEIAKVINGYDEITHNYIRDHHYNMWFTVIAPSKNKLHEILESIKNRTEIHDMMNLPAVRLFKVKATFKLLEV